MSVRLSEQAGLVIGALVRSGGSVPPSSIREDLWETFAAMDPAGRYHPCEQPEARALLALDAGIQEAARAGLVSYEQDAISTAKLLVLTEAGREFVEWEA